MSIRENPEVALINKEGMGLTKERVAEICQKNAERILGRPETKVVVMLFKGAMVNEARGSLARFQDENVAKHLLQIPSVKEAFDDVGVIEEFQVGTIQVIARMLDQDNQLR